MQRYLATGGGDAARVDNGSALRRGTTRNRDRRRRFMATFQNY